jgi:hypothetical protein
MQFEDNCKVSNDRKFLAIHRQTFRANWPCSKFTGCYSLTPAFSRIVWKFPLRRELLYVNDHPFEAKATNLRTGDLFTSFDTRNQADHSMTQISTLTLMALFAFLVNSAGLLSIIG